MLDIKNGGTFDESCKADEVDESCKARFVVQGNADAEKDLLVHNSKNVQKCSIRTLISLCASFRYRLWTQNI